MEHPTHIFTSFFSISHIFIIHDNDEVFLFAYYGNHQTGEIDSIDVIMNFSKFYDMLVQAGRVPGYFLKTLTNAHDNPGSNCTAFDLCESGGIDFIDYLFAFLPFYEEHDQEQASSSEPPPYLCAFIPNNFFPEFINSCIPDSPAEHAEYLHSQLALNYSFYLYYKTSMPEKQALLFSDLSDPLLFTLAQVQYENCLQNWVKSVCSFTRADKKFLKTFNG